MGAFSLHDAITVWRQMRWQPCQELSASAGFTPEVKLIPLKNFNEFELEESINFLNFEIQTNKFEFSMTINFNMKFDFSKF